MTDAEINDFQERKNHQDFVYETNTRLQALESGVTSLSIMMEKFRGKTESEQKTTHIQFENFRNAILPRCDRVEQVVGNLEIRLNDYQKDLESKKKSIEHVGERNVFHKTILDRHEDDLTTLRNLMARNVEAVTSSIVTINSSHHKHFQSMKNELMQEINKPDPTKSQISQSLDIFDQELKDLKKEVTNIKLAFGVVQKKFEHVCRTEQQQEGKQ